MRTFTDEASRFRIDVPAKDWTVLSGGGSALRLFTEKRGSASVLIDYMKLQVALAPNDIDALFADLETQFLKERQPSATDLRVSLERPAAGPRIVIAYTRTGAHGLEHVVQYSYPRGMDLYRVVCTSVSSQRARFDPLLERMASTFQLIAPPPR